HPTFHLPARAGHRLNSHSLPGPRFPDLTAYRAQSPICFRNLTPPQCAG
uniref:Uncharacterized protein n=1 Tax=Aegilops tauschii subsp. strangulata TaxID=200361 RepID=A0A453I1L3_AEGTS